MTLDPLEGVDADGFITTGADASRIPISYRAVIADCAYEVQDGLQNDLHGLYLYGSVATGQAVSPSSDIDLYAVVTSSAAIETCGRVAVRLTDRHRSIVRDVGISRYTLGYVRADAAERCFLRHYCVPVAGIDLRDEFARCRPSAAIARTFIGDLRAVGPRGLLRSAAVLFSFADGGWSTARENGAELIAQRAPHFADAVRGMLAGTPVDDGKVQEMRCWLSAQIAELLGPRSR